MGHECQVSSEAVTLTLGGTVMIVKKRCWATGLLILFVCDGSPSDVYDVHSQRTLTLRYGISK